MAYSMLFNVVAWAQEREVYVIGIPRKLSVQAHPKTKDCSQYLYIQLVTIVAQKSILWSQLQIIAWIKILHQA